VRALIGGDFGVCMVCFMGDGVRFCTGSQKSLTVEAI